MSNCTFATRPVEATLARVASSFTRVALSVPTTTPSWHDSLVVPMRGTGLGTAGAHHNSIAKPKAATAAAADNAPAKAGVAYGAAKQAAPPRGIPR